MRRKTTLLCIAVASVMLGSPRVVSAQESILLRFRPEPRTRTHTLWWTESTNTLREGAPGVPALDSITVESATLGSTTWNVRDAQFTRFVVDVTHDSTRVRVRALGGPWRAIPEMRTRSVSARVTVDDRLRVLEMERTRGDTLTPNERHGLRAFLSRLEFALPADPVTVGDTLTSDVVLRVSRPLGFGSETPVAQHFSAEAEVVARTTVTLDSLSVRELDTLAFMTVRGLFVGTELDTSTEEIYAVVSVSGAYGGSLIWSTGWNAFVSGAIRSRTTMTLERDPIDVGEVAMTLLMDESVRFQVRP
jgi:hypothetical protein